MPKGPIVLGFLLAFTVPARAQDGVHYQTHFPPEEFKARWEKIYDRVGPNGVAFVQGTAKERGFQFPRQTNEFYYLCGIETPHSYLVLDGKTRKATLYLPPRDLRLESAEGRILSAEDSAAVKKLTGVDDVLGTKAMAEKDLPALQGAETIYVLYSPAEGHAQSRLELQSADRAIKSDSWTPGLAKTTFGNS